jgi:hypothetical protein
MPNTPHFLQKGLLHPGHIGIAVLRCTYVPHLPQMYENLAALVVFIPSLFFVSVFFFLKTFLEEAMYH